MHSENIHTYAELYMNNLKQIPKCLSFFAIPRNCNKLHKNIDFKDALKTITRHHVTKNKGKITGF